MKITQKIKRWYNGTPYENKPEDPFIRLGIQRSKSAIRTRKAVKWIKSNYQWLIGTVVGIIGILIAIFK